MDGATVPVVTTRKVTGPRKLMTYYTGTPCIRGHYAERLIVSNRCLECHVKPPALPIPIDWWPDDGGAKCVTTANPISGRVSKARWVNCLGKGSVLNPHRFLSRDVLRNRVCGECAGGQEAFSSGALIA